ncbi:MAG: hypothetical protein J6W88_01860 [Bacteroidales bacterium]|nr:hypothetical protein [Bacteroidales bacterium]
MLELQNVSFDVDEDGNIYVLREALDILDDTTSVEVETMSGVRLWVDQRCVGTVMVDGGEHPRWSPQVLKFSPGFDTLLAARYIFDGGQVGCEMYPTYMKIGPDSKVYCINTIINIDGIGTIVVDSVQGMMLEYGNSDLMSVMVRLDGELNREWMLTVEDSVINPQMGLILTSQFYDIDFDKDSNLLFLSITAGKWSPGKNESRYSTLLVDGVPLRIGNDMAVLVFENATEVPRLRSYGVVPSVAASAYVSNSTGNLACANGRVFVQSGFSGGLRIPGNEDIGSSIYYTGSGLTIFDYNGRVIGGGSYHTSSPYSRPGFLRLQDSVLYLGVSLYDDNATFGDMTIHGNGIFSAVVKYVDTAFMSPYQAPEGGETLITDVEEPHILLYPNPFSRQVTVKLQGVASVAKTAWLTHPGGRCEPIPLVFDEAGFYTLDLAQKPDGMYYLSFKTYSGSLYTFVLLKMEN